MSVTKYEVGELVLVTPLIFDYENHENQRDTTLLEEHGLGTQYWQSRQRYGVITNIEDTLDVWYSKQDKYRHTYTVLTTNGEVKSYFSHELEPLENTKYYAKQRD